MESKKRDVLIIILAALSFIVLGGLTGEAGSLEPSGPPRPTMVTLDQLSTQINGLSSPVNKVVRGVIIFGRGDSIASDQTPEVDPNRCVVLLSDVVVFERDSNPDDKWISRNGACLLGLTDMAITIQVEPHPAEQIVSYQIIEYK